MMNNRASGPECLVHFLILILLTTLDLRIKQSIRHLVGFAVNFAGQRGPLSNNFHDSLYGTDHVSLHLSNVRKMILYYYKA